MHNIAENCPYMLNLHYNYTFMPQNVFFVGESTIFCPWDSLDPPGQHQITRRPCFFPHTREASGYQTGCPHPENRVRKH
jgi:hypothetical protein